MKKILVFLLIPFFISSCLSSRVCKKISNENLIYTLNEEEILEVGGDYNNDFGNVLIEDCSVKNEIVTFSVRVINVYGNEIENSKIEVYQFEKEGNDFRKKSLLKETTNSFFQVEVKKNKKEQKLLVFRFDNNWRNIIVKSI